MNRPANSPDLNPIENVWKRNIEKRRPTNMDGLRLAIRECWRGGNSIKFMWKICKSMPRRLNAYQLSAKLSVQKGDQLHFKMKLVEYFFPAYVMVGNFFLWIFISIPLCIVKVNCNWWYYCFYHAKKWDNFVIKYLHLKKVINL